MRNKISAFILSVLLIGVLALATSAFLGVCGALVVRCYKAALGT